MQKSTAAGGPHCAGRFAPLAHLRCEARPLRMVRRAIGRRPYQIVSTPGSPVASRTERTCRRPSPRAGVRVLLLVWLPSARNRNAGIGNKALQQRYVQDSTDNGTDIGIA